MDTQDYISIEIFSRHHGVDRSFIDALGDCGLIEITSLKHEHYIRTDQLSNAEKMIRLYLDLHINVEGIDSIMELLQRIKRLQEEVVMLRNKLRLYED